MKIIDEANFQETTQTNTIVVADFYATWCRPCHMLSPVIERLAREYPTVAVGKVNTDENVHLTEQFQISALPTVLIFKDGQVMHRLVGLSDLQDLRNLIDGLLGANHG